MTYTEEHFPLATFLEWFLPGTVFIHKTITREYKEIEDTHLVLDVNPFVYQFGVKTKCLHTNHTWNQGFVEFEVRQCYDLYRKDPSLFSFPG